MLRQKVTSVQKSVAPPFLLRSGALFGVLSGAD
jgi:hypothetical protein